MRIVHIVPALTRGGGERVTVELANHAVAEGHDVVLVAGFKVDETLLRNELAPSVQVDYIASSPARLRRYAGILPWLVRSWPWLRQADLVHCHMTMGAALGTAIFGLRGLTGARRPQIVETYHAVGMPIPPAHRWLHARLAERRDALVLMAREPFWDRFVERRPQLLSAVIPNGIRLQPPPPLIADERLARRRQLGIPDSCRLVVGTIGRLASARRPWLYVEVFAAIARRFGPDVHLLIGGSGPELGGVEQAIARHGLGGQVHLPGLIRDPARALSATDLYLTLNVGAITGLAALEAAAAEVPVVAIQLLPDHVPGADDWIASSPVPAEVAERAIELLADPARMAALGRQQRAHVEAKHSVEAMARAYDQLYRQVMDRARALQPGIAKCLS